MIYAIRAEGTEFVKIGITARSEVTMRFAALQCASPHELTIRALARWPDSLERHIHRHLAGDRVRGEWFRLSEAVQAVIDAMQDKAGLARYRQLVNATASAKLTSHKRLGRALAVVLPVE